MNCPVTCCMLAGVTPLSPGAAGPRTLPRKASSALMAASASSDADSPFAGEDEIIACGSEACGIRPIVFAEPGVDAEFGAIAPAAGVLIAGSPYPGVRFVVQPNAASVPVIATAARMRSP